MLTLVASTAWLVPYLLRSYLFMFGRNWAGYQASQLVSLRLRLARACDQLGFPALGGGPFCANGVRRPRDGAKWPAQSHTT